jgi:hypothetical protein
VNRLGEWAFENEMIINPAKSMAVCFTKARVKESLNYSLGDIVIPKANSCKCLGIILRSNLSWSNQVNYTVKRVWKAFHFTMHILKRGNSNTKSLAWTSLVRLILEYASSCWDPYREGQISALDQVQSKAQHRKIARVYTCTLQNVHGRTGMEGHKW